MKPDLLSVVTTPLLQTLEKKEQDLALKNQFLRTLGQASATTHGVAVVPTLAATIQQQSLLQSEFLFEAVIFALQKAASQPEQLLACEQLWGYIGECIKKNEVKEAKHRAVLVKFVVEWCEQMSNKASDKIQTL